MNIVEQLGIYTPAFNSKYSESFDFVGVSNFRGNAFGPWKFMREQRKDIFYETTGVLMEDDERVA